MSETSSANRNKMGGFFDLENQVVFYRSYHMHSKNVLIHVFCIPLILLSGIGLMLPVKVAGEDHPSFNLGSILAWVYGIYYICLDRVVGIPSMLLLVLWAHKLQEFYDNKVNGELFTKSQYIVFFLFVHFVSWSAQFYGHAVYEKRAPALLDSLHQALVMAPFFVGLEIAFHFGYKPELQKSVDNQAGKNITKFKIEAARKKREA